MNTLTILHFNDVYNIEPHNEEPYGGAARMVTYVNSCQDLNPLVLFSGDIFNPSVMSIFSKGEQMIPVLDALKVNCAVYGNHDFDFGIDHLLDLKEKTHCCWLMSNVKDNLTNRPLGEGDVTHMLEWNGKKIGLMGLAEEAWIDTLATLDPDDVTYEGYVQCGTRLAAQLKSQGADIVIALTHMRWVNDRCLIEEVPALDLVLGGHDHDYKIEQVDGRYIVKSGTDFQNLSKLTITWEGSTTNVLIEKIDLDSSIREDEEMMKTISYYQIAVDSKMDETLGFLSIDLEARFKNIRTQETNLGNFITDIMLKSVPADMAFLNSGSFRADRIIPKGEFKLRDLMNLLPIIDSLVVIKITGPQLLLALENGVSLYPELEGRFPQVSGIFFAFNPSKPPGQRVDPDLVKVQGEFLNLNQDYKLCTKAYLAQGKDGYNVFKNCEVLIDEEKCPVLSTAIQNHFEAVKFCKGLKTCRSGHRQSLITLVRRSSLNLAVKKSQSAKSHYLVRQDSIHDAESEQCELAPMVEGRILLIDDKKHEIMISTRKTFNNLPK